MARLSAALAEAISSALKGCGLRLEQPATNDKNKIGVIDFGKLERNSVKTGILALEIGCLEYFFSTIMPYLVAHNNDYAGMHQNDTQPHRSGAFS